ncbi:hypothetical protein BG74_00360 [Sodalis-like endosymbiont of Proechinophthirus fluctus]|nr:hypothetical protein BG74_00360 [Sodalis-like endosymbiont of Proechinophthirus fluctus]
MDAQGFKSQNARYALSDGMRHSPYTGADTPLARVAKTRRCVQRHVIVVFPRSGGHGMPSHAHGFTL